MRSEISIDCDEWDMRTEIATGLCGVRCEKRDGCLTIKSESKNECSGDKKELMYKCSFLSFILSTLSLSLSLN